MKQVALLAMIVGLSAVTMATIYASDLGPTSLGVATSSSDKVGMYGHVEFVQANSFGDIIGYYQTDNFVTDQGAACVASKIFDVDETVGTCGVAGSSVAEFLYIGLGDTQPGQDDSTDTGLDGTELTTKATSSRLLEVDATIVPNAGAGTATVTISTPTADPFGFSTADGGNVTANVYQAGLFNALTGGQVFAIQNTTSGLINPGIDVNNGDSLAVTWTITVG